MSHRQNHPDAYATEAQEARIHEILEYAVYHWTFERKLDAATVKSLVIEIAKLVNQDLFTGDARRDEDIAIASVRMLAA